MGTTPNLDLPYPESTDLVIQGDDAIQALAEKLDDVHALDAYAAVRIGESSLTVSGSPTQVDWPGTEFGVAGFTRVGGGFVYGGPTRAFLIAASVQVEVGGPNMSQIASGVVVRVDEVEVLGSFDSISSIVGGTGTMQSRGVAHSVTVPVTLAAGSTVDVIATSTPNGSLGLTSIHIYPIGPAMS